ncbi:protein DA1 [Actinoplanes sp. NPDC049802]|uniref:protein DA1 n=1 Tax=Actinoplanes sp. NPDC049802 TaxID=3154742 RepID=UPI0033C4250E
MPSDPRLGLEMALCGRCAATAVRDQAGVKRVLPPIARRIRALSIRTTTPVRVRLVSRGELRAHHPEGADALGLTVSMGTRVLDLMVVRDLPLVQFGSTVAHEVMHAYLAQQGFGVLPPPVAEGLCQLLAYAWLRDQPGPLAAVERRRIAEDPGPVYGDGFRAARAASRRLGVRAMLDHVRRNGSFP